METVSTKEAAHITGLSERNIDWLHRTHDVVRPVSGRLEGTGTPRRWDLKTCIRMARFHAIRTALGCGIEEAELLVNGEQAEVDPILIGGTWEARAQVTVSTSTVVEPVTDAWNDLAETKKEA